MTEQANRTSMERHLVYTIYIHRKAGMESASHHQYVSEINTAIILPILKKYGAISYTISHHDSSVDGDLDRLLKGTPPEIRSHILLDYDTVISIVVPNIECIEKFRSDQKFIEEYMPDHFNFADMTRSKTTLGWIESHSLQP